MNLTIFHGVVAGFLLFAEVDTARQGDAAFVPVLILGVINAILAFMNLDEHGSPF